MVVCRIILLMVDANHDSDVFILTRSRNDYLLRTCVDVALGLATLSEETSGFDDDINSKLFPWQCGWAFSDSQALNFVPIDDKDVVFSDFRAGFFGVNFFLSAALGRVILNQVSEVVSRHEVVHGDYLNFFTEKSLVANCAKHQTPDASETIDADFDHVTSGVVMCVL